MKDSFARAVSRLQSHREKHPSHIPFAVVAVCFVIAGFFVYSTFVYAATYNFVQSTWAGGVDAVSVPTHTANRSNWTKYATSTGLTVGSTVGITSTSYTFTDDGATSTSPTAAAYGGGFANGTNSTTAVSGSGTSASVGLSGGTTARDTRTDYTVGGTPTSVAFDSSTNSVWVVNSGDNTVKKLNVSTGATVGTYAVGANPKGAAFDSSTNSVWVANYTDNTVTKLNASTGGLVGTYAVGTGPFAVAFDSSTNSVWVTNMLSSNVTKVNASTGATVGTYVVGANSQGIAFDSSTNSVWVTNRDVDSVTKLNASNGSSIGTYTTGVGPRGITFDSSTNSIWVANYGAGTVTKLTASSGALVGTYTVGTNPFSATFDSSINSIWVANLTSSNVTKLTASSGALVGTYTVGTNPQGISFDSFTNSIWTANGGANTVTKLSASTGSGAVNYSVGALPAIAAFDSSTNSIWVGSYTSNNVNKLNASTGALIGTYAVGTNPEPVAFDSSTNSIWVGNYTTNNVTKLNASTGALIGTYAVGTAPKGIAFDSSTNSIWVANRNSDNVTKLNASTGALIGTYAVGTGPWGITLDTLTNSIWVANGAGTTVTKLNASTGALVGTYTVGSSPSSVAFDPSTNSIWVANSTSNNVTKLNASTGALIGTYAAGSTPRQVTFDSFTNSIWVANFGGNIFKINPSTGANIGSYAVGTSPSGVTFDPSTNSIWAVNQGSNNVTKIPLSSTVYSTSGTFTSAAINLGSGVTWGTLSWSATLNSQTITMKARSSATSDFSGATAWASCTSITSGANLSTGGCVTNGHQYIQYQATLGTSNTAVTPTLDSVAIGYSQYGSGTLTSSIFNSESSANLVTNMRWSASGTSGSETVKFQIRSAATSGGIASASWCGPSTTCDGTSYFTDSTGGTTLASNHTLRSGGDDQYFQYKVFLASGGGSSPILSSATVEYVVNAPPDFDATYGTNGVVVSQNTATSTNPGAVVISYKIRDTDGSTGTNHPGQVTPSFEYNIGGGWVAIPSNNLATNDTALKAADNSIYNVYTATWFATSTISGVYSTSAQVRVTVDDGEPANNTASAASAVFALDTKAPTLYATVNSSTGDTTGTFTITSTDDSQLKYRVCNDSTFPTTDAEGNSCDWTAFGGNIASSTAIMTLRRDASNNKPVYVQVLDARNNQTAQTIVAPATPANFDLKDVSNPSAGFYREFLSWTVFTATTSSTFSSYKIYHSTDGSSYSLLTTITDPALNYYRDEVTSATTSLQYYKAVVTTTQGNTSAYTSVLSDTPNGQGISDTTAPVISPASIVVPGATLRNTSAVITFTTDELAKGTVQYKINGNQGWTTVSSLSYVLAHSISIQGLTPNTTYNLQVKAEDASGNVSAYVAGANFTTVGGPIITNVTTTSITGTSASVEWDTATSSDSYVFYSTNQSVSAATIKGSSALVSCVSTTCHHTVALPSLSAHTTYYYYVQSTDGSSNTTTDNNNSTNYNFITTLDVTPPVVSNISTPVISPTSAVIVWQTDDPSTSQVVWGTASGSLTRTTVLDSVQSIYHVVTLSSATNDTNSSAQTLTAQTPYYFRVQSADTAGNVGTSTERTFTTTATGAVTIVSGGTPTVSYGTGLTGTGTASADATTPPSITSVSIANIGAFGAEVNLVASKEINAFVQYGLSTSYGSTEGDATFSASKTMKLNNLLEGTTYHYRVVVFDKYGNTATSNDQTFKTIFVSELLDNRTLLEKASDVQGRLEQLIESALPSLAPPFMTTPIVSSTTENSAVVTWKTNIKTFGSLRYATDAQYADNKNDYETEVSGGSDMDTTHTITLTNLDQNTTYHLQGRSFVFPQVVGKTSDILFSTKAAPITANIVAVKNDGFTVVWQTDEPTTSVVEYQNQKTGANNLMTDNTANTYHNVEIKNLPSGTTYKVSVYGVNKNGNRIESAAALRVTTSIDVTAPVISNFKVDNALVPGGGGFIQTVVGWQTDELANSSVFYEEGGGVSASSTKELANKVVSLDTYTTAHIVILPNLKSGTVYRIKVVSKDQSGNTKVFGPTSIITPNQTQSVLDIIVKNFEDTFKFLGTRQ